MQALKTKISYKHIITACSAYKRNLEKPVKIMKSWRRLETPNKKK